MTLLDTKIDWSSVSSLYCVLNTAVWSCDESINQSIKVALITEVLVASYLSLFSELLAIVLCCWHQLSAIVWRFIHLAGGSV